MNRSTRLLAAMLCSACATSCLSAPIQWTEGSGGNRHYYELVAPPQGINWTDARDAAAASTYLGAPGYLATINSPQEWNFVINNFPRDWTWIGLSDAAQEGSFQWVTGEPLTFTRWIPGEPNNAGNEDYVFYQRATALGGDFGWNDFANSNNVYTSALPLGYVVEFVPEPSTAVLASLGIALLFGARWRRKRSNSLKCPGIASTLS